MELIGTTFSFEIKNDVRFMQRQKDNIRKEILRVSRNEFFDKGFKATSMREIAKKANVGLSNIYNYFSNKDEILKEVVKPLLKKIDQRMMEHNSSQYLSMDVFNSAKYLQYEVDRFVKLIRNYRLEFNLLLHNSAGSSLENYREEFTNRYTESSHEYLKMMKEKYPKTNIRISDFFLHIMSSWWITNVAELVSHDLSDEEMEEFVRDYMVFATAGWQKLMKL